MPERIDGLMGELNTWRQVLRQTDEQVGMAQDGWASEDVSGLRDECRERIGELEAELAEIEGREYVAPQRVSEPALSRLEEVEAQIAFTAIMTDTEIG